MGLLDRLGLSRLKEGLTKTRDSLVATVTKIVSTRSSIDDAVLEEVEEALIAGDVGVDAAGAIIGAIRERVKRDHYASPAELQVLLRDEIRRQFPAPDAAADPFALPGTRPHVVMVVGINGAGKTTTIGKLAHVWVQRGSKVVIAASDTFRAAANEQLEIWAARAGAGIIRQEQGADPAAVAFDALRSAMARSADVLIVDTAGRLHTSVNLMEELKKIGRVLGKQMPGAPHEVLLVIDASTGQNGLQQAKQFGAAAGVTGVVVTKLDGTARGGIVLAIARSLGLPVKFIGVGERVDDLQPFDAAAFVDALFEG